ncbi:MAG TPA: hypothetical protein VHI52_07105 [Verrucomicrobiae bacterium]|nr:hypothetical protein [Verrucomicrobiae bacterium]
MNPEAGTRAEPHSWPAYRWWGFVALVSAAQLGLILWLGDQGPVPPRSPPARLTFRMVVAVSNEFMALTDPTLLALPHRESFAGEAWLQTPNLGYQPFNWSEPPKWLMLPLEQLGATFQAFLATNQFAPPQALAWSEPEFISPDNSGLAENPPQSTVMVTGELASRRMLTSFSLTPWPNSEVLTNTIVQVLVNANGRPYFVTVLDKGSGSVAADKFAVKEAWKARFEPLPQSASQPAVDPSRLTWGLIVFNWFTVPPPATNAPPRP